MLRRMMFLAVALLAVVPAGAQQLVPGVWFGIPTAPNGQTGDERFEVEAQNGHLVILWAPYGVKPVNWGTVVSKPDGAIEFDWLRSPSGRCVLRHQPQGDYFGTCSGSGQSERKLTLTRNEPSHGAELGVTEVDFRILQRAQARLSEPSVWNRRDERACEDDLAQNQWSLFCALYQASVDVAGAYIHRRPVTTEARAVVAELTKGRAFEHRLRDFNNLQSTTFTDITAVFERTRIRLEARRAASQK